MRMDDRAKRDHRLAVAGERRFVTGCVTSADGATIGYRRLGQGPGLVLLHGTMSSGQIHVQLAEELADAFTVYLPDRRGRGLSGPFGDDYSIKQEIDDLGALLGQTGADDVFGISTGAIVSLEAALTLHIRRVALWEPPLFLDRSEPTALLRRFDEEMARGEVAAALVTAMKGAQMGPRIFNVIPRGLLTWLTRRFMASEDRKGAGDYVPMSVLAPTLHYDFRLVVESSGDLERYRAIDPEVLLLGGAKSPTYLKTALDALEKTLPHARRTVFSDLDHAGPWNADRGGRPQTLAHELRWFFKRQTQQLERHAKSATPKSRAGDRGTC